MQAQQKRAQSLQARGHWPQVRTKLELELVPSYTWAWGLVPVLVPVLVPSYTRAWKLEHRAWAQCLHVQGQRPPLKRVR